MSEPLKVGDRLWRVPSERRRGSPHEVTVIKVGRKWATTEGVYRGERVNLETLAVDGGEYSSPAQCYRSREEYERRAALAAAWDRFARFVRERHTPPAGVDFEWIEAAHEKLGIPK